MKNYLLLSTFVLLFSSSVFTQTPTQVLRGTIIDKDAQIPLIGATVTLLNTDPLLGTSSDLNGSFRIEQVPVGRYDIVVTYIGYEDLFLRQLLIGSGKEVVINLQMEESVAELKTVEVVASEIDKDKTLNQMATVSARSFTVEETSRYAGSIDDPARMAQSYAGISAGSGFTNEIVIRGNSARGLQWRIEGIQIPNPNHFAGGEGSSGGGISILSNTMLSNSDFFTGAFPAEYGNALSGVFDVQLRKGNNEKREYAIQAGFLGLQVGLEGPISKGSKASYLLNYRYSTIGLLQKMGFNVADASIVPQYQDIGFNVNLPTTKIGQFSVFGIAGLSDGGVGAERDSLQWEDKWDLIDNQTRRSVGVIGLTYRYLLNNGKTYFKLVAAVAGEENIHQQDSLDRNYELQPLFKDQIINSSVRTSLTVNHKFNAKHLLRAGLNYDWLGFRSSLMTPDPNQGGIELEDFTALESDLIRSFVQWQWRPEQTLKIVSGIHQTSFVLNNNHVLEPRAGVRWQFRPSMSLSYGLGLHSQVEPISLYANNLMRPLPQPEFIFENGNSFLFSPRTTLRLTQSFHNVLGFDWNFAPDYRFKAEIYYQKAFNVPVKDDINSTQSIINYNAFDRDFDKSKLVNKGFGRNYGLELTVEKFFSKKYYFLLTSSLFKSEYQALDEIWRPGRFDRGYIMNILGGKEFSLGKNDEHILGINTKLVFSGGNRFTPIDLEASREAGREILMEQQAFSKRYPDFFRLDLGGSYRWNQPNYALVLTLEVQNASNHTNIEERFFDPYSGKIREVSHLGWIPVVNLRIEF